MSHKFLKGKGADLAESSKTVPNGHVTDASIPLGDANSAKVQSDTNAKKNVSSNFDSFLG